MESEALISCELSLIKVSCNTKQRAEIMKIAELMQAKIVDVATTCLTLQSADTDEHTETLISLLHPVRHQGNLRSGTIAIEKGAAVTARKATALSSGASPGAEPNSPDRSAFVI